MASTTLENFTKEALTFFELDSRGIGTRSNIEGDTSIFTNYIEIPTPAWYPDSFLRSLKRNSYFNMVNNAAILGHALSTKTSNDGNSLDFYEEDDSNIISGLVKGAVKSIVSTGLNQISSITKKVDSVIDGVNALTSGLFGDDKKSASYEDMINEVANNPFIANQPYVTIYGLHVTEKLRETIKTFQMIVGFVSSIVARLFSGVQSESLSKDSSAIIEASNKNKHLRDGINVLLGMPKGTNITEESIVEYVKKFIYDDNFRLHGISEFMLDKIITGTYNLKTKLPYLPHNVYTMVSSGENGFTAANIGYTPTSRDGKTKEFKSAYVTRYHTGLNTIWSQPIDWFVENAFNNVSPYGSSFYIYNDTLEHSLLNLFFIWSFGAVSEAVTDTFFVRPPYLFTLDIPGGFRYKYCTCDLEITPCGKMRKMSSTYSTGGSDKSAFTTMMTDMFNYNVNPKAVEYIPDYYKIDMKFTSFLPDLWNYKDSYLHDHERAKISLGKHEEGKINAIMKKFD